MKRFPLSMTVAKLYISDGKGLTANWFDPGVWGAIVLTIDRKDEKLPHLIKILDLGVYDDCSFMTCAILIV